MKKTYRGRCHCGAVQFEAGVDFSQGTFRCNCSVCRRTRFWVAVAMPDDFRLIAGESDLVKYLWGPKKNEHYFCRHCGVRSFGIGTDTPIGRMYGVNIGCLEGLSEEELSKLPITHVDGMNDRWNERPPFFIHL